MHYIENRREIKLKKAYINLPDSELGLSDYLVKIEYMNGDTFEKRISNYSYSNIFEKIKENHEGEHDSAVKKIVIEHIR